MNRTPLPCGHVIHMANGAKYIIEQLIGEGGFSLIYSAKTTGGASPVVIKEFFPSEGAYRNSNGKVLPLAGKESKFRRSLLRFEKEGIIGGSISKVSFQTISFLHCGEGYAIMKQESTDMLSLSSLVGIWSETEPTPFTGNLLDRDPVFPDLVRIRYSLRITESILAALSSVHNNNFLHLDISGSNVLWGGQEISTGENCEAFLADFGCSAEMNAGEYHPEYQLSYSPGFAAPEVQQKSHSLSPATDLYSVGILLFYLCIGQSALEITHNRRRQVQRETSYLAIPRRICERLQCIIQHATDDYAVRYQTAEAFMSDVRDLRNSIPIHPINPDNTKAFTLYSLKSMLEGSDDTHYSWANELMDRRGFYGEFTLPTNIYAGISWHHFQNDADFIKYILPDEILSVINQEAEHNMDSSILSCNYDMSLKKSICTMISHRYDTKVRILQISRSLLNDESVFFTHQKTLFKILTDDDIRLRDCYTNCIVEIRRNPYIGLAMLIIYALLGSDGFKILLPSPMKAGEVFFSI